MISYKALKSKYLWIPVLLLYSILHVTKLELYPLCLFGMYSQPLEKGPEQYNIYSIEVNNIGLDYTKLPYKKFLMLNNTLKKFDNIINNQNVDPAVYTLRKTMRRMPGKVLNDKLESPYHYKSPEEQLTSWLHRFLQISESSVIKVRRQHFVYSPKGEPQSIINKIITGE